MSRQNLNIIDKSEAHSKVQTVFFSSEVRHGFDDDSEEKVEEKKKMEKEKKVPGFLR